MDIMLFDFFFVEKKKKKKNGASEAYLITCIIIILSMLLHISDGILICLEYPSKHRQLHQGLHYIAYLWY